MRSAFPRAPLGQRRPATRRPRVRGGSADARNQKLTKKSAKPECSHPLHVNQTGELCNPGPLQLHSVGSEDDSRFGLPELCAGDGPIHDVWRLAGRLVLEHEVWGALSDDRHTFRVESAALCPRLRGAAVGPPVQGSAIGGRLLGRRRDGSRLGVQSDG